MWHRETKQVASKLEGLLSYLYAITACANVRKGNVSINVIAAGAKPSTISSPYFVMAWATWSSSALASQSYIIDSMNVKVNLIRISFSARSNKLSRPTSENGLDNCQGPVEDWTASCGRNGVARLDEQV